MNDVIDWFKMNDVIGWVIAVISGFNIIYMLREGRDDRGKMILYHPLMIAFTYLIAGYVFVRTLNKHYIFDSNFALDILFGSALVIYVVILLRTRRWYS
ncbi:hypothetical protein EHS13_23120 [Paenibacillus psychroresistens]|uniref:Uncharacterized protein n=1 Tax=Paenibacillus psychroresistens TaxID=1778678 RepID=A0A6B8RPY5_9BACL|nr:hypothetical protein [Paenibacillus psychroresistens]QGQ97573.1 hypothetical protein EHS13_23120 [Paenibacillus psychroresistens]